MKTIDLKRYYPNPELYEESNMVDVSDEVANVMEQSLHDEKSAYMRSYRAKAYYSLDYGNGVENYVVFHEETPEEIYERKMTIFYEPLSLRVKQGVVTAVGVFVDFAVSYAFKSSGTGQSFAETADAGEHIYELDQGHNSRWGCLPDLRRCLIGAPHQKQKQPVIGCTKQNFFTVHNV